MPVERAFSHHPRHLRPARGTAPSSGSPASPLRATATMKSVCRQRNAGVCSTSTTSATAAICAFSCTSVSTGSPSLAPHLGEDRRGPRPCRRRGTTRARSGSPCRRTTCRRARTPARAASARSRSAWRSAASRDSITHGPAISASGAPPPIGHRPDADRTRTLALHHLEAAEERAPRARRARCWSAALMKPLKSGWQSIGRDLNSGWNWQRDEARVVRQLDHLDQRAVGRQPGEHQAAAPRAARGRRC